MTQPGETLWNLGLISNAQALEMSQTYQVQWVLSLETILCTATNQSLEQRKCPLACTD